MEMELKVHKSTPLFLQFIFGILVLITATSDVLAQSSDDDFSGRRISAVNVVFAEQAQPNTTYKNAVLRAFATYPDSRFDPMRINLMLNKVKRLNFVNQANYHIDRSANGDLELNLDITLSETVKSLTDTPIGWFANHTWADFPTLYANDRSVVGAKLENKTMLFSNTDAFFGRPEVLTSGNP